MNSSGRDLGLASYNEIFMTDSERAESKQERVREIPLTELHPFRNHPFKVIDNDRMKETADSIRQFGVLVPGLVRPLPDGGYEIISGHRRRRACEIAGLKTMPVIVREMDDDSAVIAMVDANCQREDILPSERAKALQMKLEALKHQGARSDLTSVQVGQKLNNDRLTARERVAKEAGESTTQIQRILRINNLTPELQNMVDEKRLAFNPAVEISYLNEDEQKQFVSALEETQNTPSLAQAKRIKEKSREGGVSRKELVEIMAEEKKPLRDSITLTHDTLKKFFPRYYTIEEIEKVIIKLLEGWKQRQRDREPEL